MDVAVTVVIIAALLFLLIADLAGNRSDRRLHRPRLTHHHK